MMRELTYPFEGELILKKSKKLKRALLEQQTDFLECCFGRQHDARYHTDIGAVFAGTGNPPRLL